MTRRATAVYIRSMPNPDPAAPRHDGDLRGGILPAGPPGDRASPDPHGAGAGAGAGAGEEPHAKAAPDATGPRSPSALELTRIGDGDSLSRGRERLYAHIARRLDLGPSQEFLIVPCGRGETVRFLADSTGAAGAGVDHETSLVDTASQRARHEGLASRTHFDPGADEDLPYQDAVFDVTIGDVGLGGTAHAARAVAELARVTKPMGSVVLIQPVWTQVVEDGRREVLVKRLGFRPFVIQQWKQMLRDAGVVELHAEDLSQTATSRSGDVSLTGLSDFFLFRDKLHVIYRAAQRWGWRGIYAALSREQELRRLISWERVLGLSLIHGTRWRNGVSDAGANGGKAPWP